MGIFDRKPPNPEVGNDPPTTPPAEKSAAELIAESLKPVVDAVGALSSQVSELKAASEASRKPPEPAKPTEVPSVYEDENAAFNARIGPVLHRQLEFEATVIRDRVKAEYVAAGMSDMWAQFGAEIDSTLNGSPLVQNTPEGPKPLRGDPTYIRNVVDMIIGREARKAGMRFDSSKKQFFLEAAGSTGEAPLPSEAAGFTPEQLKFFQKGRIPLADAKKAMAKLKFVS